MNFDDESIQLVFWFAESFEGFLISGADLLQTAQEISQAVGTMRPVPAWLQNGLVLGVNGGQNYVESVYNILKTAGV
jgi:hypothetical protein